MKRKKAKAKLTTKEKLAALIIAGLCIPAFFVLAFVFQVWTEADAPPAVAVSPSTPAAAPPPSETPPVTPPPAASPQSAPAKPQSTPAKQPAAPAKQPSAPAKQPAAPAKPQSAPAKTPAAPAKPQSTPAKQPAAPAKPQSAPAKQPAAPAKQPAAPASPPPTRAPEKPQPARAGTLVYVIDDAGNNLRELEPFLRYPGPLTIAVLPGLPNSAEAARRIRAAGKEVFLHQPMEAIGGMNPGPSAIYAGMSASEVRAILAKNVAEIGPIAGMNNHQGSLITQNAEIMRTVLEFCRDNGLLFLDSRTTADSIVPSVARNLGISIAERNIFLDNEQDRDAIIGYHRQGASIARERRSVVMIGHTWSPALADILSGLYSGLRDENFTFQTVGGLMRGGGGG